jgi:hypothetical protein
MKFFLIIFLILYYLSLNALAVCQMQKEPSDIYEFEDSVNLLYKPVNSDECPDGYFKMRGFKKQAYLEAKYQKQIAEVEVEKLWLLERAKNDNIFVINENFMHQNLIQNKISKGGKKHKYDKSGKIQKPDLHRQRRHRT